MLCVSPIGSNTMESNMRSELETLLITVYLLRITPILVIHTNSSDPQ